MVVAVPVGLELFFRLQQQEVYQLQLQVIQLQLVQVVLLNQHQIQVEVVEEIQDQIQFLQAHQLLHQPEVAVPVVLLKLKEKELEQMEDQVVVHLVTGQCLQEQVEQVSRWWWSWSCRNNSSK